MVKLIRAGHPQSKPYFIQICEALLPLEDLAECERNLILSQEKYEDSNDILTEMLEAINYASEEMIRNTTLGFGLQVAICQAIQVESTYNDCTEQLGKELARLDELFQNSGPPRGRQKRFSLAGLASSITPVRGWKKIKSGTGVGKLGGLGLGIGLVVQGTRGGTASGRPRRGCTHRSQLRRDVLEHFEEPREALSKRTRVRNFVVGGHIDVGGLRGRRALRNHPTHGFEIGWKVAAIIDRPRMRGGQDSNQACRDRVQLLTTDAGLRSSDYHCGHILANRFGI